jgi:superfamily II DNA helicase RecQ
VLELTPEGLALLKERKLVRLTKPVSAPEPKAPRVGEIACDEVLFESLVRLRKQLADERALPPHIIFSDVTLRQMAREYPANERELGRISGMSQRKLQEFGRVVLAVIMGHLEMNPRQIFAATSFEEPGAASTRPRRTTTSAEEPHDKELFERLRQVRRKLAEGRSLPAYCILHDSALRQMARDYPANEGELILISGVGEKRTKEFGAVFLTEIEEYLRHHPRQVFGHGST